MATLAEQLNLTQYRAQIKQWQTRVDALSLRERGLLLGSIIAAAYVLWTLLWHDGLSATGGGLEKQLHESQQQQQALQLEVATLSGLISGDPDKFKKQRIAELKKELEDLNSQLSELSQGLVMASHLPQVLEQVLRNSSSLTLVSVTTLPVEIVPLQQTVAEKVVAGVSEVVEGQDELTGIFKHSVELRLRGSYFQVLAYLQALEQLPWRFYWDWLEYEVDEYPGAEAVLRVYTISAEEGLLGV